jgi:hypothetical protein
LKAAAAMLSPVIFGTLAENNTARAGKGQRPKTG